MVDLNQPINLVYIIIKIFTKKSRLKIKAITTTNQESNQESNKQYTVKTENRTKDKNRITV